MTLKLVGREILSVVKLGGEKWEVGGRAVPFLPIPSRIKTVLFPKKFGVGNKSM